MLSFFTSCNRYKTFLFRRTGFLHCYSFLMKVKKINVKTGSWLAAISRSPKVIHGADDLRKLQQDAVTPGAP